MEQAGKLNVIVYGLGKTALDAIDYIRLRFHVIGCSDSDPQKVTVAESLGIPFILPDTLSQQNFDYILLVSVYDSEISEQLIKAGIAKEKLLNRIQWEKMLFWHSFGEQNPDKTFYLLSRPMHFRDGIFSFVFAFLEQMDIVEGKNYIPVVDMQSFWNQYLEEDKVGIENAWNYYFQPLSEYSLAEVYTSRNVVLGYDDPYPYHKDKYIKKHDIKRMAELYHRYIHYNKDISLSMQKEYEKYIDCTKTTLGVLYRGTDMSALKLRKHFVQPTVDEMIVLIRKYMKEWGCERIFLSTEDAEAAERFKAEFGSMLSCTDQKRFSNTGESWLANIDFDRPNDKYLRGLEYLITIELLSRCDSLLAGICTGSICAQIMSNGKYQHVLMVDKGEY